MANLFRWMAFSLCFLLTQAQAGEDIERNNLAKMITEIDFLLQRIDKIKHEAADNQRIRFHYQDLKKDLQTIRSGLADYINADINNGRIVKPLDGQYR